MTHHWDEFSKSLAEETVPRRESLRRLGFVLAGAVFGPFGLESALAAGPDPCKAFCRCRSKSQQKACLDACNACNKDTSRLCGTCGTYVCCREPGPWEYGACVDGTCQYACADGAEYCDGLCTFLDWDPDNCDACGNVCPEAAPFCTRGICTTTYCAGANVLYDRYNCGACGRVCGGDEVCGFGACVYSGGCTGEGC